MKKRVLLKATVTALGVAGGICRAMVLSHVDSRGLVVDAPLLNGLTFGAVLLVLACRAAVCACAALEVQRSALAEALWAAVAAVLALSSTRATNCSYRVGGRSSEPPSVGRVA